MEGFSCTHNGILNDVPHQLWEAISSDGGGTPLLVTRVLHNKPLFFAVNYLRCYFHYLSPHFFAQQFGPGVALIIVALIFILWRQGGQNWKVAKIIILLYPILLVFELQTKLFR